LAAGSAFRDQPFGSDRSFELIRRDRL